MLPILLSLFIQPFESDLCTLFPEGEWGHCCFEHDLHYWVGGDRARRNWVDKELRYCVKSSGHPVVAQLIYHGVRWGRFSPLKIPKHQWGNAFPGRERYRVHSAEEIFVISEELKNYDFDEALKDKLLDSL